MKAMLRGLMLALLCCSLVLLSSCSFFKDYSPNGVDPTDIDGTKNIDTLKLDRRPYQLTFMVIVENADPGSLFSLSLCKLDTSASTFTVLQIPAETFVRSSGSVASFYSAAFTGARNDGRTTEASAAYAVSALKGLLQNSLLVTVDYTVRFSSKGLADCVDTVGGLSLNIPFVIHLSDGTTLNNGRQTLGGSQVAALLNYSGFESSLYDDCDLDKLLYNAFIEALKSNIDSSVLPLCVLELHGSLATDIPSEGGSDVHIVKQLLNTSFTNIRYCRLKTSSVSLEEGKRDVIYKSVALDLINEYYDMYQQDIEDKDFDPDTFLGDPSDKIIDAVYTGSVPGASSVTGQEIRDGAVKLR